MKRFYIFTGKGGVGKTTLSLAFTKYLESQGKKALHIYFDDVHTDDFYRNLGLSYEHLQMLASMKEYVSLKLRSKTIGSWVAGTSFFRALSDMIPGFGYTIYLKKILDKLQVDPELIIVLDSPSSGHALTMLEATSNFQSIFQAGQVFDDMVAIADTLKQKDFLKINICSFPTHMALNEAVELKEKIQNIFESCEIEIMVNNSLVQIKGLENISKKPSFISKKLQMELTVFDEYKEKIVKTLPHIMSAKIDNIIEELLPHMKGLT